MKSEIFSGLLVRLMDPARLLTVKSSRLSPLSESEICTSLRVDCIFIFEALLLGFLNVIKACSDFCVGASLLIFDVLVVDYIRLIFYPLKLLPIFVPVINVLLPSPSSKDYSFVGGYCSFKSFSRI